MDSSILHCPYLFCTSDNLRESLPTERYGLVQGSATVRAKPGLKNYRAGLRHLVLCPFEKVRISDTHRIPTVGLETFLKSNKLLVTTTIPIK